MKIATWNLKRPNTRSARNAEIVMELKRVNADILVLTETHSRIDLGGDYEHTVSSDPLPESRDSIAYEPGENRVTIWSKHPLEKIKTSDPFTTACAQVVTRHGELKVFGTVIGILGNRHESFLPALEAQTQEWKESEEFTAICVAGDFNLSFADNYYFTKDGRALIVECFAHLEVTNLTEAILENIDHIAISSSFVKAAKLETQIWNQDKKLSDHLGISVTLNF
jgi:endonuclease/exonuclease/phosphatase family metal-dependent hydrolase